MSTPDDASVASPAVLDTAPSSESKAVRSAIIAASTNIVALVLKFGSSILIARLLTPRDLGITNLAWVVLTALILLSDVGLDTAVVRSERGDDPDYLDVVWTVGIVRSLVLWFVLLAAAVPIARFYDEPLFVPLLPVIGLVLVLEAARSTYLEVCDRRLDQAPRMKLELYGLVLTIAVQLAIAYAAPGPWAIVVGSITASAYRFVASHRMNDGRPNRFAWNREFVSEIVGFGKWVFVSTAFTFVATQGDRILLGKVMSLDLLGVYGVACAIALIPHQIHGVVASRVVFPLVSNYVRERPEELGARLRSARTLLLSVMLLAMIAVVSGAGPLFDLVYPDRFRLAGALAPIVAWISWVSILQNSVDRLPLAHGESRLVAVISFVSMVARLTFGLVGFRLHGLYGFLGGLFAGAVAEYIVAHAIAILRYRIRLVSQDVAFTAALVVASGIVALVRDESLGVRIATSLALVSVALAFAARVIVRRIRSERAADTASESSDVPPAAPATTST